MPKRKASLTVKTDLSGLFNDEPGRKAIVGYPIEKALVNVIGQMQASGLRERTISDYRMHVGHFIKVTGVKVTEELTADHVFQWLSSMNVSKKTKLTRLKCLKAFLLRCFDNGWIATKFWKSNNIKVDSPVKEGATDREIKILLSMMDLTSFVELRDAAAILIMYQTGIRVGTIAKLENNHVNLDAKLLKIDGRYH